MCQTGFKQRSNQFANQCKHPESNNIVHVYDREGHGMGCDVCVCVCVAMDTQLESAPNRSATCLLLPY